MKSVCLLKLSLVLTLILLLVPANATASASLLKINNIYVLWTYPVIPQVDAKGHFIVGLRPFCKMIGAKTDSNIGVPVKKVRVSLRQHSLQITVGSRRASVDGQPFLLSSAPVLSRPGNEVLIPVEVLTRSFHIPSFWNRKTRTLTVQDALIGHSMQTGDLYFFWMASKLMKMLREMRLV